MPRRLPDSDDDDEDFGLRTPVKKPVKADKAEKKAEPRKTDSKSTKRVTDRAEAVEEEAPAPRRTPSGKREALPRPSAGGGRRGVMVLAGLGVALAVGGGVALFAMSSDPPPAVPVARAPDAARPAPARSAPKIEVRRPQLATGAPVRPGPLPVTPSPDAQPAAALPKELADKLAELRRRSANHEAIARLLEEYAQLTRIDPLSFDPNFVGHNERELREQQLLAELQRLGAAVVPALQEMLLELDERAQQLFLCKALAGIPGPEALAAVEHVLSQTRDVPLQTTLVRFLPDSPESTAAIGRAFGREQNPNLRSMLLREYARRLGEDDESGRETFLSAATQDPDPNVRAEAITIIGRRGDARDQGFLMQVIQQDDNLPIRQRAIVSYAETGKDESLPFLEDLARDPNSSLPIRASAVLAIGRVGGDRALSALDGLALSDPDQEIRQRAQRMAASIRARQQAEREGHTAVEPEGPIAVPAGPTPLNRP